MMTDSVREQLFYAIKECVEGGVTVTEFKQECVESWAQALRDRMEYEIRELKQ